MTTRERIIERTRYEDPKPGDDAYLGYMEIDEPWLDELDDATFRQYERMIITDFDGDYVTAYWLFDPPPGNGPRWRRVRFDLSKRIPETTFTVVEDQPKGAEPIPEWDDLPAEVRAIVAGIFGGGFLILFAIIAFITRIWT